MMGCDIHIVLERRRKGSSRWIGEFTSDNYVVGSNLAARSRDYDFFGRVAAVWHIPKDGARHYPNNLPRDVSELAWDQYMTAPTDYHTPSHLSAAEFCEAFLMENPTHPNIRREHVMFDLLGIDSSEDCEYRVVFWFDN